jgi:hypothetical protein
LLKTTSAFWKDERALAAHGTSSKGADRGVWADPVAPRHQSKSDPPSEIGQSSGRSLHRRSGINNQLRGMIRMLFIAIYERYGLPSPRSLVPCADNCGATAPRWCGTTWRSLQQRRSVCGALPLERRACHCGPICGLVLNFDLILNFSFTIRSFGEARGINAHCYKRGAPKQSTSCAPRRCLSRRAFRSDSPSSISAHQISH